jgi:hypothetical protein
MKQRNIKRQFVICVQNESSEDLEIGKVYQVLPDESADREHYVRVIDESGEDYLYPAGYFVPIALPQEAERALLAASSPVVAA